MKKVIFTLISVILMSVNSMAATNERIHGTTPQSKVKGLSDYLELDEDQKKDVAGIIQSFDEQLFFTKRIRGERKAEQISSLVKDNVKQMRGVLSWEQYRKYLNVLNAHLANRNLKKYIDKNTNTEG